MKRLFVALAAVVVVLGCSAKPVAAPVHHAGSPPVTDSAGSPAWIVDQLFGWTAFPDEGKYITGEIFMRFADAPTPGSQFPTDVKVQSRQMERSDSVAVFATDVSGPKGSQEYYTWLANEHNVWRASAIRSLDLANPLHFMLDSLRKGKKVPNAPPTLLGIMELTVSEDTVIATYLRKHDQPLTALVQAFRSQKVIKSVDVSDSLSRMERRGTTANVEHSRFRTMLEGLDVSTVFTVDQFPGCTFVRIGGVARQQIGYVYAPKECKLPPRSPERFIYLAPISGDWYEYKAI